MTSKLTNAGHNSFKIPSNGNDSTMEGRGTAATVKTSAHLTVEENEFLEKKMKAFEYPNDITIGLLSRVKDFIQILYPEPLEITINNEGDLLGSIFLRQMRQTEASEQHCKLFSHLFSTIFLRKNSLPLDSKHEDMMGKSASEANQLKASTLYFKYKKQTS